MLAYPLLAQTQIIVKVSVIWLEALSSISVFQYISGFAGGSSAPLRCERLFRKIVNDCIASQPQKLPCPHATFKLVIKENARISG